MNTELAVKEEITKALKDLRETLKPKAVVFDLGGVLVDSSERYRRCLEGAMREYNASSAEGLEYIAGTRRAFWKLISLCV